MLVKLSCKFFTKRRAPATFCLAKKFSEIDPCGQFHQLRAAFAQIFFAPKKYKKASRETFVRKKTARKMLVKLTPGGLSAVQKNFFLFLT